MKVGMLLEAESPPWLSAQTWQKIAALGCKAASPILTNNGPELSCPWVKPVFDLCPSTVSLQPSLVPWSCTQPSVSAEAVVHAATAS